MLNAINWFEIPVNDMTRAIHFYETMLGAKLRRENFGPPGQEMAVFEVASEEGIAGALLSNQQARPSSEGTLIYLNASPSIDACIARASSNGGRVRTPKTALPPGMGHFAHIEDSEGNCIGLHALA